MIYCLVMKLLCKILPLLWLSVLVAGCSGSREFRLDAASDDIATQNVTLIYPAGDGYRVENVPAVDGHFSLTGMLSEPPFAEVYTAAGTLLGEFIVDGGDQIEARFSAMNPENISIKGNKDAEMLAQFVADNRDLIVSKDIDGLNRAIAAFVRKHPKRFVSTVLMTRYYTVTGYEREAYELLDLIPGKYRRGEFTAGFEQLLSRSLDSDSIMIGSIKGYGRGDSAIIFNPAGTRVNLVVMADNDTRLADSIKNLFAVLRASTPSTEILRITEMGCDRDTLMWKTSLRALPDDYPADIERIWLTAGMATTGVAEATPTDLPYFILTDSTGRMLYGGPSASATRAAYGRIRKTK